MITTQVVRRACRAMPRSVNIHSASQRRGYVHATGKGAYIIKVVASDQAARPKSFSACKPDSRSTPESVATQLAC